MIELPGDIEVAFSHLAAVGLASIVEDSGAGPASTCWSSSLDSRPRVAAPGLDADAAARIVHAHAVAHADPSDWTAATVPDGSGGLLSPRLKVPADDAAWGRLSSARREVIDDALEARRWLDLALIGALGEPAYWRFDSGRGRSASGVPDRRPDEGASRWEMKTRNRGEDFVAHRLRRLALAVTARAPQGVRDGLTGTSVVDEAGLDAVDSRTATGLASPGPVDNALAWCALWGLSALPVIPLVLRPSRTAGHLPAGRSGRNRWPEHFYLPVPERPVGLARYRHVVLSAQLATFAAMDTPEAEATLAAESARAWLSDRAIAAVVRFPVGVFGSASAPERRALLGSVLPVLR